MHEYSGGKERSEIFRWVQDKLTPKSVEILGGGLKNLESEHYAVIFLGSTSDGNAFKTYLEVAEEQHQNVKFFHA